MSEVRLSIIATIGIHKEAHLKFKELRCFNKKSDSKASV